MAVSVRATTLRPPLKWAGGKRWQLKYLRPLWRRHRHRRLIEPFCGGLGVALGLTPDRALLNDINPHLVNFYRWLKRGLSIAFAMENDAERFYQARRRFNALLQDGGAESPEAAGLFYYLNRTGYNGLCRFNGRGLFNVPFGQYKSINYRRHFDEFTDAFAGWEFTSVDFERLEIDADDFIYADPPYDVPFTQYSRGGFNWDEQERTAVWLAKHAGPVVLSNQATPRILSLYKSLDYNVKTISAPRRISCTGDRTAAREVLAFRNIT